MNATVKVVGDGAHFEALVIASEFAGKRTWRGTSSYTRASARWSAMKSTLCRSGH